MKADCSRAQCPFCGARDFILTDGDVFQCNYCNEKFTFDLDNFDPAENKVAAQELKELFSAKKAELESIRYQEKKYVLYFSQKADASWAGCLRVICALVSAASLVAAFVASFAVSFVASYVYLYLLCILFCGVAAFIGFTIYKKKAYKKYHFVAMYYAARVARYDEQIAVYTKLISKLTD